MAVNKEHIFEPGIYFITFTNYKWLHLFSITDGYSFVYKWFDSLKRKGHSVLGYVIMPNHIHVLIGYTQCRQSINTIVGNGKRFIAYDIVDKLQNANETALLQMLAEGVSPSDRKKGTLHEVFEPSFDCKLCRSYKFITQKLNYINNNPVSKKWQLVSNAGEYIHSSARFYERGYQGVYEIVHVNDWTHNNWTTDERYKQDGSEELT